MTVITQEYSILNKKQLEVLNEYHLVHSKLRSETVKRKAKALVCTALEAGEGTTTTCGSLAMLFAKEGNRVLVVDANTWNPGIHSFFKIANEKGLASYLKGFAPIDQCIQHDVVYDLDVMPTGMKGDQTSNALYSLKLAELITDWKTEYDYILIDTPSVFDSADAMFVAKMCDGVVLVCESERHSAKDLQRAKRVFEEEQLIGIVVTKVD